MSPWLVTPVGETGTKDTGGTGVTAVGSNIVFTFWFRSVATTTPAIATTVSLAADDGAGARWGGSLYMTDKHTDNKVMLRWSSGLDGSWYGYQYVTNLSLGVWYKVRLEETYVDGNGYSAPPVANDIVHLRVYDAAENLVWQDEDHPYDIYDWNTDAYIGTTNMLTTWEGFFYSAPLAINCLQMRLSVNPGGVPQGFYFDDFSMATDSGLFYSTGFEPIRLPGEGQTRHPLASENFDDPSWSYIYNNPKSTADGNGQANVPGGTSTVGYVAFNTWYPRIVEDTYRGHEDVIERTTSPTAAGAGALRLTTKNDGISITDCISWQHTQAITPAAYMSAADNYSAVVSIYAPDPNGTTNWGGGDWVRLMGMVGGASFGQSWPWVAAHEEALGTNSWVLYVGQSGQPGDSLQYVNCITKFPALRIAGAGWWKIGTTTDGNGLNYFIRQGLGDFDASHYIGTRRSGLVTDIYSMPGGTLWMERGSTITNMPDWVIDELNLYYTRRVPGTLIQLK
jgi:hypothetical protein